MRPRVVEQEIYRLHCRVVVLEEIYYHVHGCFGEMERARLLQAMSLFMPVDPTPVIKFFMCQNNIALKAQINHLKSALRTSESHYLGG
jgi:hypothetical protein